MKKKDECGKISSIEVEIGDITLKLTPMQAMELRDILDDIYPKKRIEYVPYYPVCPREDDHYPWPQPWITWYTTSTYTSNGTDIKISSTT